MRYLAIFCAAFALSLAVLQYGPDWSLGVLCAAVLLGLLMGLFQKRAKRLACFTAAMAIAFGGFYQTAYDVLFVRPALQFQEMEAEVTLTVATYPIEHSFGAKCQAMLDVGAAAPVKVQFYGNPKLFSCAPGDRVTTAAKIKNASYVKEGKITSFTSKGMQLRVYGRDEMEIVPAEKIPLRYIPLHFSRFVRERIAELYTGQEKILMTALLTGDRTEFDDRLYSRLSETGVTHVTAVSGMHCAFLFGLIQLLIRNKRKATLVGLPILFFFMLMVGAAPSVMRACFMLTLLSVAPLIHRENDSLTTMSFALFLILLQNPYAIASIGLQLSFLSVLGILLFARRINHWLYSAMKPKKEKRHPVLRFVCAALGTTCAASVFTVPLAAFYFDCVSLISPLTNLLCLSAISFAFCGGIISVLLSFVSMPLAGIAAIFPAAALEYFMGVVRILSEVPYHAVYTDNSYLVYWLVYFYAILFTLIVSREKKRRAVALGIAASAASLALVVALPVRTAQTQSLTVKVMNVGQGECVLFSSGEEAALVDCGSSNSWKNAGSIAANALNTLGHRDLDYMILTHYDNDHVNGLDTLFSRMEIRTLILPENTDIDSAPIQQHIIDLAEEEGTDLIFLREEREFPLENAKLRIHPPCGKTGANEIGLSILCSSDDFDMLVTGDMDADTEKALIAEMKLPDIEVFTAGHHGSKYSSGYPILDRTKPEVTVIPVGPNSYGHPADETLARFAYLDMDVYRTDLDGTVTITVY